MTWTLDEVRNIAGRYWGLQHAASIVQEATKHFGDAVEPDEVCSILAKQIEVEADKMKANIPPDLWERFMKTYEKEVLERMRLK